MRQIAVSEEIWEDVTKHVGKVKRIIIRDKATENSITRRGKGLVMSKYYGVFRENWLGRIIGLYFKAQNLEACEFVSQVWMLFSSGT